MVKISEIMKKDVVTVDPEMPVIGIARVMSNNKFGAVVVSDVDEKPVGIVTWSRIIDLIAHGDDINKLKAKNVMAKKLVMADQTESIMAVAKKMVKNNIDRIPVINKDTLVGIVSYKDILATTPEMIEILSEKIKATMIRPPKFNDIISGLCEQCGQYSDELSNTDGRWVCEECID